MKTFRITYSLFAVLIVLSLLVVAVPVSSVQAATQNIVFKSAADATVRSANPNTNYGLGASLVEAVSPETRAYVKFNVANVSAKIVSARLRFYAKVSSTSGINVSTVADTSWKETVVTFNTAPALGSRIGSASSVNAGTWVNIDVTSIVKGNGTYAFALTAAGSKIPSFDSRQATNQPRLVLTVESAAPAPSDATPSSSAPVGVPGTWKLKFSDEFSGTSLSTAKWTPNWLGAPGAITKPINGAEASCYDPKQVSVANGSLKLSAVARSCNGYKYASGAVTSSGKYTFTYGYMEARIWLDGSATKTKNWPAFWADGTGKWPTTGEIDVMEGLGGTDAWHFHWGQPGADQQVGGHPSMSNQTGWHIFGANWEKGSVKFYYDGKYVGQATSGITGSPMFLIFNYGLSGSISGPIQVPSNMLVDYVRVWQH